ncbi:MAG: hypothetical protein ACMG6E_07795 [Candidatus Roizmanbacteria bacterium]
MTTYLLIADFGNGMGEENPPSIIMHYRNKTSAESALICLNDLHSRLDIIEEYEPRQRAEQYQHLQPKIDEYHLQSIVDRMFQEECDATFKVVGLGEPITGVTVVKYDDLVKKSVT